MTEVDAAALATVLYGIPAGTPIRELGSNQDRNWLLQTADGPRVLKVANRAWGRAALEAQDAALLHIAERAGAGFAVPRPVPSTDGSLIREAPVGRETLLVRMLTFVEGKPLSGRHYLAPSVVAALGKLAGAVVASLADFEHPGLDREGCQWDLRNAARVVSALLPSIGDERARADVAAAVEAATARLAPLIPSLRTACIHGDITDDNVVGHPDPAGRTRPSAVIDFGDLGRGWLVAELAITATGILRHAPHQALSILPAVRAFHAAVPLTPPEVSALWPLLLLRAATLVASGEHQSRLDPDNESSTGALEGEWAIFRMAASLPLPVAEEALRAALGMGPAPAYKAQLAAIASAGRLLPGVAGLAPVDLSSTSELLHSGMHLKGAEEELQLLREAAAEAGEGRGAATRWAEARLTRTVLYSADAPATCAMGVEVAVAPGTAIAAPWEGRVVASSAEGAGSLTLEGAGGLLMLRGVAAPAAEGATLPLGGPLGTVGAGGTLRVQLCVDPALAAPEFVPGVLRPAWAALCPDPSPLLGTALAAPDDDVEDLLARRTRSFARVQEHYYASPMRMERGWLHTMCDTEGRSYIDCVNNVAAIGHSHPRLAEAVHKQMRLFNSNSRFHYKGIAELSERLSAMCPPGLDTVFLVNSGSEAVDLALRMAQVVTGRWDVVAVKEAYHGWTLLSDAVTTSLYDNPKALETRPPWIHLAAAPNSYRGVHRGAAAPEGYAADIRAVVEGMARKGTPPAAFICEPIFGNAGGVMLPEGYLRAAYEATRAAGGLCVADEVQVGYGRIGHKWWAHELAGVVPDMITIAKSMGNGYPLGAVITRRDIAEAFSAQGNFFSSAGGSPVSCAVGLTVLDVIRDDKLQENAALVGDHLAARLQALSEKHAMIGAIHGMGLYLGVELVKDRDTLEPATAECYAICERLRELGCIVQPTGERTNILKMKPPMCMTREAADFFVEQLDATLTHGW